MAADYGVGVSDEISRLSLGREKESGTLRSSELNSQGVVVIDITQRFAEAAQSLEPGEVVKDGFFTLFESVSALEIMDPKMDSGVVQPGEEFEELYDVTRPLLPEEVLGIIDQLLCHEMSWHLGYPLSQTVFTSVYVEALLMPNPLGIDQARFVRALGSTSQDQPMHQVLRAYCLGMLKACNYVNERIKSEHFYEEEDFVSNTYNRTLLANVATADIRQAIADARQLLKSLAGSVSQELLQALDNRLLLRDIFLSAAECPQHVSEPEKAREPWEQGLLVLPMIESTRHLGKPVHDAFSVKLQKKLASTIAPRPIVHLGFEDAFGHLTRLFKDGVELIGVLHYTNSQCLQTFVSAFQSKKPQPLVYVRTLLQTFLFDAMEVLGSMSIRQMLDDDFSIVVLPASLHLDRANDEIEAVHDPRFTIAQQMEIFRQRAAQPYLDILRTFCQNRCRVRRTLYHVTRAWDNLQLDAEEIDQIIQTKTEERPVPYQSTMSREPIDSYSLPLSSWAYFYKLKQMEWIVQLGFELEVYQADELAGMYWYLNYLAKCRLQHTERIRFFIMQRVIEFRSQPGSLDFEVENQLHQALSFVRLSLLNAAVTWELSDAMSCLYTVLNRLQLVKQLPRPYSNDELRYDIRMKPFVSIGLPELPTFEEFAAATTQADTSALDILEYAEKALAGAKKGIEVMSKFSAEESFSVGSHDRWTTSVKNWLKSSIAAGLAITTLQKALQNAGEEGDLKLKAEVPTPDRAYHEWWIAPKLVPIK